MKPAPWTKKFWFAWTVTRLTICSLIILGTSIVCATLGLESLRYHNFAYGIAYLLLAFGLPVLWIARFRVLRQDIRAGIRHELRIRNLCPRCEYDLRASKNGCPECGWKRNRTIEL